MSASPGTRLAGVSGPDGVGKSTLIAALLDRPGYREGTRAYLYGCILCRRAPTIGPRRPVGGVATAGTGRRRFGKLVRAPHGLVDAFELWIRLRLAERRARREGRPVILTDRTPLDGLAKHDPRLGSVVARCYLRLARRYRVIVLLDAPADLLFARDQEHGVAELDSWRSRFAKWAEGLPNVQRVEAGGRPVDDVANDVQELLAARKVPGDAGTHLPGQAHAGVR